MSMTPMPKMSNTYTRQSPLLKQNYSARSVCNNRRSPLDLQIKDRMNTLRSDLIETPNSKHKYKQVLRDMKEQEKNGFSAVIKHVFSKIVTIPRKIHWRLILDLADFAKRESRFREAKLLFRLVAYLQPFAY
jgi:hypothetical protein